MQTDISKLDADLDEQQKQSIIDTLTHFIESPYAVEQLAWDWDRIQAPMVEGSLFSRAHRSASVSLSILLRRAGFSEIRERRSIPAHAIFLVDETGRLYFSFPNLVGNANEPATPYVSPRDITADVTGLAGFSEDLAALARIASLCGGWITTGGTLLIGQWLRFQQLHIPAGEEETRLLLDLLRFSRLPDAPRHANYWQVLDAPADSPYRLDENSRAIIGQVTERYTGGEMSLVADFGNHLLLENTSSDNLKTSQNYRLQRLTDIAVWASAEAREYINALGWFPDSGTPPPTALIEQLLIAAMLLDLDPELDIASTHFAGFDLYAKEFLHLHPAQVRTRLEKHLIEALQLNGQLAPLVAQWVLGGMAPEYQFAHWPSEMRLGTPAWVVGCQTLHLVESLIPGCTRDMTYQHLMGFGQSVKAMPQLAAMQAPFSVDPVVTWALMNGVIARDSDNTVNEAAITHACDEYARYTDKMLSAIKALSSPLPDRKQLALNELKARFPDCDPDEQLVKHRGSGGGGGRRVSVLDLYMGDELHSRDWDRVRGQSIYESFPDLEYLFPVSELYDPAVQTYFDNITGALASNIEFALSQLSSRLVPEIEYGAIGIYSVQKIDYRPESPSARPGVTIPAAELPGETGRYGVILCAQYLQNKIACFELFPMRMECRENPELEAFLAPLVSGDYFNLDTQFANKKKLEKVPVDLQAYLQNVAPRNGIESRLYLRKIGQLRTPTGDADADAPTTLLRSPRKEALGRLVAEKNPHLTQSEIHRLGLHQSDRERAIEKTDAIFQVILNMIIPFKSCVEGLSSGDPKKQGPAILDCIVDAAVLLMTFAALPAGVALSASKASSLTTRLLAGSRVLASTTLSLFNPLSGLPDLIKGGGKLIGRGISKLGGHTATALRKTHQHLRYLTGANTYDLIKAIDHTGSAAQVRMSLDTLSHGRALLKNDTLETVQQVVSHLSDKHFKLPGNVAETEWRHLVNNAVKETAFQSKQAGNLESLIGRQALDELTQAFIKGHPVPFNNVHGTAQSYTETLAVLYELESKKARYMQGYQQDILKLDLGRAPYSDVMPEALFNRLGYTDPSQRATAWMLNGSTSSGNDFDNILGVLREYTSNKASLTDPNVIREIHRKLVPDAVGRVRDAGAPTKYGSSPTGFALLEQHLKHLDVNHQHFDKHLLAAVVGFQGFGDGNGRTASALYSISQLRNNRFTPMPPHVFRELNGIF